MQVSFMIRNNSSKMVKRLNVSVVQSIDIAMFTGGHHSARISQLDTTEGCPLGPGSTLQKEVLLSPTAKTHLRTGVALDGRLKGDDTSLARCPHSLLYPSVFHKQASKIAFTLISSPALPYLRTKTTGTFLAW